MSRRQVEISVDAVARAIKGAKKGGIEVRNVRIEPNGAVVINGEQPGFTEKQLEESAAGYL